MNLSDSFRVRLDLTDCFLVIRHPSFSSDLKHPDGLSIADWQGTRTHLLRHWVPWPQSIRLGPNVDRFFMGPRMHDSILLFPLNSNLAVKHIDHLIAIARFWDQIILVHEQYTKKHEMVHVTGTPSIKDGVSRLRQRCVTPIGVLCLIPLELTNKGFQHNLRLE